MNRNNIIRLFFAILTINTAQCIDRADVANYLMAATIASGVWYIAHQLNARKQADELLDPAPCVELWARDILAKNGLTNADSIPLKIIEELPWQTSGYAILINAADAHTLEDILTDKSNISIVGQKKFLSWAEFVLLHEKKHYSNGDCGKRYLVKSAITGFAAVAVRHLTKNMCDTTLKATLGAVLAVCSPILCMATPIPTIVALPYIRYQEREADRYAFMQIPSIEAANDVKEFYQEMADRFETGLVNNDPSFYEKTLFFKTMRMSFLPEKTIPFLSKKVNSLNEKLAENNGDENKVAELLRQKRRYIEAARFIYDPEHPHISSLLDLSDECIEKRKADLAKELERLTKSERIK